jgi:hypothetical protein
MVPLLDAPLITYNNNDNHEITAGPGPIASMYSFLTMKKNCTEEPSRFRKYKLKTVLHADDGSNGRKIKRLFSTFLTHVLFRSSISISHTEHYVGPNGIPDTVTDSFDESENQDKSETRAKYKKQLGLRTFNTMTVENNNHGSLVEERETQNRDNHSKTSTQSATLNLHIPSHNSHHNHHKNLCSYNTITRLNTTICSDYEDKVNLNINNNSNSNCDTNSNSNSSMSTSKIYISDNPWETRWEETQSPNANANEDRRFSTSSPEMFETVVTNVNERRITIPSDPWELDKLLAAGSSTVVAADDDETGPTTVETFALSDKKNETSLFFVDSETDTSVDGFWMEDKLKYLAIEFDIDEENSACSSKDGLFATPHDDDVDDYDDEEDDDDDVDDDDDDVEDDDYDDDDKSHSYASSLEDTFENFETISMLTEESLGEKSTTSEEMDVDTNVHSLNLYTIVPSDDVSVITEDGSFLVLQPFSVDEGEDVYFDQESQDSHVVDTMFLLNLNQNDEKEADDDDEEEEEKGNQLLLDFSNNDNGMFFTPQFPVGIWNVTYEEAW